MAFEDLLIDTIIVHLVTPGSVDRYGNPTDELDAGTPWPARVEAAKEIEHEVRRDTFISLTKVFVGPDCVIDGTSIVEWNNRQWEVFGETRHFEDGTEFHHLEFLMRGVTG